jgi:hypothetical protein
VGNRTIGNQVAGHQGYQGIRLSAKDIMADGKEGNEGIRNLEYRISNDEY